MRLKYFQNSDEGNSDKSFGRYPVIKVMTLILRFY